MISTPFLSQMLSSLYRRRKSDRNRELSPAELLFRREVALVFSIVSVVLGVLGLGLYLYENNRELCIVMTVVMACESLALVWLHLNRKATFGPIYLTLGTLAILIPCLFFLNERPDAGGLIWYPILAAMPVLALGLVQGTAVFLLYWLVVAVFLLSPLQLLLPFTLPAGVSIRFLLSMLGSFGVAFGFEYIRVKKRHSLVTDRRMEDESMSDALTSFGNRRAFYHHYRHYSKLAPAAQRLSIVLIDLDFFKKVNDSHGYQIGDRVLHHIAHLIHTECRETDVLYRWGGEEFLLFIPDAAGEETRAALERIRCRIENTGYWEGSLHIPMTVSFGFASGRMNDEIETLINAAEAALYLAKRKGRNRVEEGREEAPAA